MCVRVGGEGGGGWERWSEDTLPLPGAEEAERDTDVREQKFPREKRANSAHFPASHHETQFVRA